MNQRMQGQVALVTGAGSGIGRAVVERYVADGARVAAVDVSSDRVAAVGAELGDSVLPLVADVREWDANRSAVDATVEKFGKLDVFVGNAGISDHARSLQSMTGDELGAASDELFAVNVKGYLLGVRAALEPLLSAHGCVVLTASYASFYPGGGGALYTASKHAVLGVVRQLAYELAPDVRVNGVAPGVAPTTLTGIKALGQTPQASVLPGSAQMLPLATIPSAESYGGLFSFLASRCDAGHITGTVIVADSGLSVRGIARPSGRIGTAAERSEAG